MTTAPLEPCLVCGGSEHRVVYESTYEGTPEEAADYFLAHRKASAHGHIRRCDSCSFAFTSPRFAPAEYDRIYATVAAAPAPPDVGITAATRVRFRRLATAVSRRAGDGVDLLDFGCGDGAFLKGLENSRARGFDVGEPGRRQAGRSTIFTGSFAGFAGSADCPPGSLDAITAFDVLEHLPLIDDDLDRFRLVLKPGGLLFASVPNIDSLVARILGRRWSMILLEHLWYFSPATLTRLMHRHGFDRLTIQGTPYEAPVSHIATRLAQSFGLRAHTASGPMARLVLPAPAGLMLAVFRKR